MNGYEACTLINKHMCDIFEKFGIKKKILIYALTADGADETKSMLRRYPFTKIFDCIRNNYEVKLI